jgi:hypothetical protein
MTTPSYDARELVAIISIHVHTRTRLGMNISNLQHQPQHQPQHHAGTHIIVILVYVVKHMFRQFSILILEHSLCGQTLNLHFNLKVNIFEYIFSFLLKCLFTLLPGCIAIFVIIKEIEGL